MNTSSDTIELGDICFDVVRKDIKNVHLSVHPPFGRVTISVPSSMDLETIRLFSISKLGWIRKHQSKLLNQKREAKREYVTRESHYFLGKRYLLKVVEQPSPPRVVLKHDSIELYVMPASTLIQRESLLHKWYREYLKKIALGVISDFEDKMNVKVSDLRVRSMRTKWGTCNPTAKRIWLNTELAKKSLESIEYIVVHEMVHILERHHNERFIAYMDRYLPTWRHLREDLNRSELGHVDWSY
ncbi:M48 family metallopeptidase [Candidatus Gracilibacteria bacterium]|nr:M48 family metallopeptidase [Candidatus Gracilibacteria bacterium]